MARRRTVRIAARMLDASQRLVGKAGLRYNRETSCAGAQTGRRGGAGPVGGLLGGKDPTGRFWPCVGQRCVFGDVLGVVARAPDRPLRLLQVQTCHNLMMIRFVSSAGVAMSRPTLAD